MTRDPLQDMAAAVRQRQVEPRPVEYFDEITPRYRGMDVPWFYIGFSVGMGLGLAGLIWGIAGYWVFYGMVSVHLRVLMQ